MTKKQSAARYVILEDARNDLRGIRRFTIKRWGKEQSYEYLDGLEKTFKLLALNPDIGYDRSNELKPEIRSFFYKSHAIYYKKIDTGIAIIGVFHHSMLPLSHLPGRIENFNFNDD